MKVGFFLKITTNICFVVNSEVLLSRLDNIIVCAYTFFHFLSTIYFLFIIYHLHAFENAKGFHFLLLYSYINIVYFIWATDVLMSNVVFVIYKIPEPRGLLFPWKYRSPIWCKRHLSWIDVFLQTVTILLHHTANFCFRFQKAESTKSRFVTCTTLAYSKIVWLAHASSNSTTYNTVQFISTFL